MSDTTNKSKKLSLEARLWLKSQEDVFNEIVLVKEIQPLPYATVYLKEQPDGSSTVIPLEFDATPKQREEVAMEADSIIPQSRVVYEFNGEELPITVRQSRISSDDREVAGYKARLKYVRKAKTPEQVAQALKGYTKQYERLYKSEPKGDDLKELKEVAGKPFKNYAYLSLILEPNVNERLAAIREQKANVPSN